MEVGRGAMMDGTGPAAVGAACLCLALRRASRRVSRLYDEALAPHGLTSGQFGILGMIAGGGDGGVPPSVQDLADAFEMDQSAMSRTLKPLMRDGLIADAEPGPDRRRRTLTLTDHGRARIKAASGAWAAVQTQLENAQPPEVIVALRAALDRIGRDDAPGR